MVHRWYKLSLRDCCFRWSRLLVFSSHHPPPQFASFDHSECHAAAIRAKPGTRGSTKRRRAIDDSSVDDHGDFVLLAIGVPQQVPTIGAEGEAERARPEPLFMSMEVLHLRPISDDQMPVPKPGGKGKMAPVAAERQVFDRVVGL